jgi:putative membrane protein
MKYSKSLTRSLAIAAVAIGAIAVQAEDTEKAQASQSSQAAQGGPASSQSGGAVDKQSVINNAGKMNLAVQKVAELAQQKAQSPELKQFAQTLKQDHQKWQQDLERIAQKHSVTLPTSVDAKCQEEISKLQALSGAEFDKEFAKGSVEGHAMAVAQLQQASTAVQDQDVKQYAQKLLAKLKEHQRTSRQIAQSVGIDQTTITSLETKGQSSIGAPAGSESSSRESSNSSSDSSSQPKSNNPSTPGSDPSSSSSQKKPIE